MTKKQSLKGASAARAATVCAACDLDTSCTYPEYPKNPGMSCDDAFPAVRGSQSQVEKPADTPTPEIPKGLCSNCENRMDCRFHKPESGVWHCEEYM